MIERVGSMVLFGIMLLYSFFTSLVQPNTAQEKLGQGIYHCIRYFIIHPDLNGGHLLSPPNDHVTRNGFQVPVKGSPVIIIVDVVQIVLDKADQQSRGFFAVYQGKGFG